MKHVTLGPRQWTIAALLGLGLLYTASYAMAEPAKASFGVTILLRTFDDAGASDRRCTQSVSVDTRNSSLRLNCPSAVEVKAAANTAAGWRMDTRQMLANPYQLSHYDLVAPEQVAERSGAPMELTLSW